MKTKLLILFSFFCLSLIAEERQSGVGNGGGGVQRNGRVMTFYTARIPVEKTPLAFSEIPGLELALDTFFRKVHITDYTKSNYIKALKPSVNREYYKVDQKFFSSEMREKLIQEYKRTMDIQNENIVLFAVTEKNITYLLPEFYQLTRNEQAAILFHEAFWYLKPKASYSEVIESEFLFQALIEEQDPVDMLNLVYKTGNKRDVMMASLSVDLKKGFLKGLVDKDNTLPLEALFGDQFVRCLRENRLSSKMCFSLLEPHFVNLVSVYPKSLFLPLAYNSFLGGSYGLRFQASAESSSKKVNGLEYPIEDIDFDREFYDGWRFYQTCVIKFERPIVVSRAGADYNAKCSSGRGDLAYYGFLFATVIEESSINESNFKLDGEGQLILPDLTDARTKINLKNIRIRFIY